MTECYIINGLHCGKRLDIRIDYDDEKSLYILYGYCKKCGIIVVFKLFNERPTIDVDFTIFWDRELILDGFMEVGNASPAS